MADGPKLGIDIGASSIKLVELFPAGKNRWKMGTATVAGVPVGGIVGNQNNIAAVSQIIAKLLKDSGVRTRRVVASIPEDQISSHIVEMPMMSETEIGQALQWQVEQYIPIPAEKAVWSYQVIKKDQASGGVEILLVASAKSLINAYTQVLEAAGLEVLALETELMAISRAVVPVDFPLSMVVDMGAKTTSMGVVRTGQLVFSRTIPTAGESFTRAIETGLGLDSRQAEEYKSTYGFADEKMGGKLTPVMRPVLTIFAGEIKKTMDFFSSKNVNETIRVVTLTGGAATMPELASLLSASLGVEVVIANPFVRVQLDSNQSKILAKSGPFYSVATGLGMREI